MLEQLTFHGKKNELLKMWNPAPLCKALVKSKACIYGTSVKN